MSTTVVCKPDSSDEVLRQGCLNGDRLAQKYVYERYGGYMMGICMRYANGREEATSMLNAGFFKVFEKVGQFEGRGSFKAWIAKVMMYTCIDWVRRQANYRKKMDFDASGDAPIDNEAMQNLAVEAILEMVQRLPTATRTVFSLYTLDGYNHREIADMLGISEGTSKWHLSDGKKKLREMIKWSEYEGA
ncbi:MAG: sigma-70 family RNA polymerase sigma factor [Phaeodactylibacter sp.]|uniref:RNA polymerase sigma factor n=1 Tax=Phaeodactylibacter sp. TaxID=1940289 RepID=UPI0032EC2083